ncbi:helix-turn-helix transcriptional regulator [Sphingomonas sp. GB1N7]|uniref:helix-turn-helix transcriptional regulator n=1 Tax=Parasphingomonas caseinilytica TaxID=3096158 RepID=UPI002FC9928F
MANEHERILRLNAVLDRTGLSRSSLYRKVQSGTFPKSVQLSARCVGWHASAVDDWVRNPVFYDVVDNRRA